MIAFIMCVKYCKIKTEKKSKSKLHDTASSIIKINQKTIKKRQVNIK